MTSKEALCIIRCLIDGRCPFTGRDFPPESLFQDAEFLDALRVAVKALERAERREHRDASLPGRAGGPWDAAEDQRLCDALAAGHSISELAKIHQRTRGAIQSRLEKLGKLLP